MQAAFLCAGQREQFKKLEDPSEQQCGEHRADTDAVKRAVLEQAQSSADGNHREVKPVLDGGKPQMKHLVFTMPSVGVSTMRLLTQRNTPAPVMNIVSAKQSSRSGSGNGSTGMSQSYTSVSMPNANESGISSR